MAGIFDVTDRNRYEMLCRVYCLLINGCSAAVEIKNANLYYAMVYSSVIPRKNLFFLQLVFRPDVATGSHRLADERKGGWRFLGA